MNKQAFQNNYFLLAKGHSWVKLDRVKNYMSPNEFIELYFFLFGYAILHTRLVFIHLSHLTPP